MNKPKEDYIYPVRHELAEKYAELLNAEPYLKDRPDSFKSLFCDLLKQTMLNPE